MLLFEEHVTLLLILHTFFALATVGLSTHLVLWLRHYVRGRFGKRRSILRFATLSVGAYAATMLLGMALYPTYKIRVRAEYLENPSRIHRDAESAAATQTATRANNDEVRSFRNGNWSEASPSNLLTTEEIARRADAKVERGAKLARWFDVKEHWALLGFLLSLACCGILWQWKPNKESKSIAKMVTALAFGAAALSWAAAVIGIATAAARSVAAL